MMRNTPVMSGMPREVIWSGIKPVSISRAAMSINTPTKTINKETARSDRLSMVIASFSREAFS
jgi:hypothetical protein